VDNFRYTEIVSGEEGGGGECHIKVEGPRKAELRAEDHLTVRGDQHTHCKSSWLVKAGGEIHLESLMKAVIEAGADLTLKVGPSFVHLAGGNVEIVGPMVSINSGGSPGEGTPAEPLLPEEAEKEDTAPFCQMQTLREAVGQPYCAICEYCEEDDS
jgi:type VI secretion system secreted protein VgrG